MTKKLAELSGSVSVLSASVILLLAILISPIHLPEIRFVPSVSPVEAECVMKEEAPIESAITKTSPVPDSEDLAFSPNDAFHTAGSAYSGAVYGLNKESAQNSRTVISSVLAVNQSVPNFAITASVTPEEYEMLLFCVGNETRSGSLMHKVLITEVIFNRVQGPKFGATVKDVVLSFGQFDVMVNYQGWGDWTPDETTVQAVNLVLSGSAPDYAEGALYFCNPYIVGEGNWFDMTRQVVCEIEGHRFYR
jgi:hypothetical protein